MVNFELFDFGGMEGRKKKHSNNNKEKHKTNNKQERTLKTLFLVFQFVPVASCPFTGHH